MSGLILLDGFTQVKVDSTLVLVHYKSSDKMQSCCID